VEEAMLNRIFENKPYKIVRKILIAIVGVSVILIGAAMVFLPGPAIVVIPIGLAILATEFAWAKVLLHKLKEKIRWKTTTKVI
jgi:uncharacterized protein (TIGR02611 family)